MLQFGHDCLCVEIHVFYVVFCKQVLNLLEVLPDVQVVTYSSGSLVIWQI